MQALITLHRHLLISLAGCCQSKRKKKSWNPPFAYSDTGLILALWIPRYASNHSSAHSWLFRTLSLCVCDSDNLPAANCCLKVSAGLKPMVLWDTSTPCPIVHPWPWGTWAHVPEGLCWFVMLPWFHFLIAYYSFIEKSDIGTIYGNLWLWSVFEVSN